MKMPAALWNGVRRAAVLVLCRERVLRGMRCVIGDDRGWAISHLR